MLAGFIVHPDNMLRNLKLTDGLVNTEAVMMALAPRMGRGKAHDRLSQVCIAVSNGKGRLIDLLSQDEEISKVLSRDQIEKLLDPPQYLGSSGKMVDRVLKSKH